MQKITTNPVCHGLLYSFGGLNLNRNLLLLQGFDGHLHWGAFGDFTLVKKIEKWL